MNLMPEQPTPVQPPAPKELGMKKNLLMGIILVLVLLVVAVGVYWFSKGRGTTPTTTEKTESVEKAAISITAGGFTPATLSVKNGTVVTWTNSDNSPHQIASNPHPTHTSLPELFSGALIKGGVYSFSFEKTGTFTYHDHLNPLKFKGTIIVK